MRSDHLNLTSAFVEPGPVPGVGPLRERLQRYRAARSGMDGADNLLGSMSRGHDYFGFNRGEASGRSGVWYREWAPGARALSLFGDFNGWDRDQYPLTRDGNGVWSLFLPDDATPLAHRSLVKVHVVTDEGARDRIPAYIRRVVQDPRTLDFTAQVWLPAEAYRFQHVAPSMEAPRIYEAHVGMAQEEGRVGTFDEFRERILPRIADLGYNTLQLMAVMEHPYYGSFGYHVSNFYAVSSRFGTPENLKRLIDTAHGMGIRVLLDLIHSHSVKNTAEGLNRFDGTDFQYFHTGARGLHAEWDSLVFDYGKHEVRRFLLSNLRYWLEEFRFDGFRFDGVTSMLYLDHGLNRNFTSYNDYFGAGVDGEAITYLQLANHLVHVLRPDAVTVAEDVSGMPALARPVEEGGLGFDYRLAMGVPDFWTRTLKERQDEDWSLTGIWHQMLNRRSGEKHIGYLESHDQSLVGDRTLAFQMMDQAMYWHMHTASQSVAVDRGVALLKMVRLLTFSLAGEGWLNFIGNEFGHPEWVDFPREGNGFSFQYARRQWSLSDDPGLRYRGLKEFDRAMNALDRHFRVLADPVIEQLAVQQDEMQLVYRHGPLVFAFNFHPTNSCPDLRIPVPNAEDYRIVLDTDMARFGGHGRVRDGMVYPSQSVPLYERGESLQIYLPSRSAQVLAPARLPGAAGTA